MDSANEVSPNGEDILNLSAEFLDLSRVMDWLEKDKAELERRKDQIYNALLQRVTQLRANYDEGRSALDDELPSVSFNSLQPATFVLNNLLRGLFWEPRRLLDQERCIRLLPCGPSRGVC